MLKCRHIPFYHSAVSFGWQGLLLAACLARSRRTNGPKLTLCGTLNFNSASGDRKRCYPSVAAPDSWIKDSRKSKIKVAVSDSLGYGCIVLKGRDRAPFSCAPFRVRAPVSMLADLLCRKINSLIGERDHRASLSATQVAQQLVQRDGRISIWLFLEMAEYNVLQIYERRLLL